MTLVKKIDSNVTGLRIAEESTDIGVLPGSPIWNPFEPNTYGDFGVEITSTAREPISDDRQALKGMVTDLDASGGFVSDFTHVNLQSLMQGFLFADFRRKDEVGGTGQITSVTTTYNAASGLTVFEATALVFMAGFSNNANNGLKLVSASTGTTLTTSPAPVAEASPPATATIVQVGRQFAATAISVDASGTLPAITAASGLDTLGITPSEWVFLGGDLTAMHFVNAVNNGFKRVATVTATRIEFDKSLTTMVTETGTGLTIQLFMGRYLKNETGALIKRRTYQMERTLGAPDNASPSQIQSEYIIGAVANQMKLTVPTANKVTADLSFMGLNGERRTGVVGVKSGTRPSVVQEDAFNTSSDFSFMRVSPVPATGANATPSFGFLTDFTLTVNNNVKASKAIGTLGGFEVVVGQFQVSGDITAYFTDVASIDAVQSNTSVTVDMCMANNNRGMLVDIPLLTLGKARLDIQANAEIKMPVTFNAAKGLQVASWLNHTLSLTFFDYLPNLAM